MTQEKYSEIKQSFSGINEELYLQLLWLYEVLDTRLKSQVKKKG